MEKKLFHDRNNIQNKLTINIKNKQKKSKKLKNNDFSKFSQYLHNQTYTLNHLTQPHLPMIIFIQILNIIKHPIQYVILMLQT